MKVNRFILPAVFALAFVFSCSDGSDGTDGVNGAPGADGVDGKNGTDGTSCVTEAATGTELASGDFKVICDGVVVGYLRNGADGENGKDGSKGDKGDKGDDGSDGADGKDGADGEDGNDGVDCDVAEAEDNNAYYVMKCGDVEKARFAKALCGMTAYDPATHSCYSNQLYSCDNQPYDVSMYFCSGDQLYSCGSKPYNPAVQFCLGGLAYDLCDGGSYNPSTHSCYSDALYSCGNKPYNPAVYSCYSNTLYSCNNQPYNPSTHYCYSNLLLYSCGNKPYNSDTQFCYSNVIYSKCGGIEYSPATQFCSGSAIHSKCGGADYNLVTQYCDGSDNKVKNMSACSNPDPTTYFCDTRGGKLYKYVVIGTQTWMAENLNFNTCGSKCYNNSESNCDIYGRLYNWATAMNIDATYNSIAVIASANFRGVCPVGWHVPSRAEWDVLTNFVGGASTEGTKLKATSGWNVYETYGNGTDDYGFSALPGGYGFSGDSFYSVGNSGYWWSASGHDSYKAYSRSMYHYGEDAGWGSNDKSTLFSVRCLQDVR